MTPQQNRQIMLRLPAPAVALFTSATVLLVPLRGQAGPALYANSFSVNVSQADCLKDTRSVLIQAGMRQQDINPTTYKDVSGRDVQNGWSADHPSENISVVFECDARNGMGAIAVSGSNNNATYKAYGELWKLWIK